MSSVLVTGASGFIGKALAGKMSQKHQVICMSRKKPDIEGIVYCRGDFCSFEDLRQLDKYNIQTVVHLGAVTGGCLERDGILVNVEGTRCLMRYLIDRGCKKFVMASSIAAVGFQNTKFRPLKMPIPDEHPCLDRDGYGISKFLMEEVTKYYQLQNPDIDVINLRLSSVIKDKASCKPSGVSALGEWGLGGITMMVLDDAVRAFMMAAESPLKPGVRILNTAAPKVWATAPTAEILRNWWGKDVDLSFYEKPANKFASAYDVSAIKRELGFEAEIQA